AAMHGARNLDVAIPVADALAAASAPEWPAVRGYLQMTLAMTAQRTVDDDVRVRWFRSPAGRELTRIVGPIEDARAGDAGAEKGDDAALLKSLIQGSTNAEIAAE